MSLGTACPSILRKTIHFIERSHAACPDGYFKQRDNTFALLEFKCPFKRKIAMNTIPRYYHDQTQTGLALSGDMVSSGLFVDAYFRMYSLELIGPCQSHNSFLNGTNKYKTESETPLAWGVCYIFGKQRISKKQKAIIDLGSIKTTKALFEHVMKSIAEKDMWCCHGAIRMKYTEEDKITEAKRLGLMHSAFKSGQDLRAPIPVALFI